MGAQGPKPRDPHGLTAGQQRVGGHRQVGRRVGTSEETGHRQPAGHPQRRGMGQAWWGPQRSVLLEWPSRGRGLRDRKLGESTTEGSPHASAERALVPAQFSAAGGSGLYRICREGVRRLPPEPSRSRRWLGRTKPRAPEACGARGRRGHLLLVVILAVELLVPVEARGLQGLFAGGALHALLVPEAVVEPQQKPVRDDPLTALADRLGAHRSAYRSNGHSLVSRAGQVSPPPGRTRSRSRTEVDVPATPPGETPCSSTQMTFGEKTQIKSRC